MDWSIGSLTFFHDLIEIHEYLSSLPIIYLYQYQGMIIALNGIPLMRVLVQHDMSGQSYLSYINLRTL